MKVRVCSGFSPQGRISYGERFLRAFDRYWAASVELQVYVEESMFMPRGAYRDLWSIPGAADFYNRHVGNPKIAGRVPQPCWKGREVERGYSFKTDALKFFRQIVIPESAAVGLDDGDVLIWLDGDVETTAQVPDDLAEWALGHAEIAFLGRAHSHSEIGFYAISINQRTRHFLHEIALMYTTDAFLDLPEWHSAYVWDTVRVGSGLKERNLVLPGLRGHVWPSTKLASWMRHDKGQRKPI